MNIPNILTIIRFFLVPLFILTFFSSSENYLILSSYIFIFAGITDVLDGYIARRFNLITKWGQAMDPLADKLMQLTVLICLTVKGILPPWVMIVVGIKETCMVVGGIFLYFRKEQVVIPANKYGKIATIVFYAAILSVIFGFAFAKQLVYLSIAITIFAFIQYCFIGVRTIRVSKPKESSTKKIVVGKSDFSTKGMGNTLDK